MNFPGGDDKYFSAVLNCVLLFTTLSYVVIFPKLIKLRSSHPHVHGTFELVVFIAPAIAPKHAEAPADATGVAVA